MTHPKRTAINASVSLALLFMATTAGAAPIGTVTDLDGTLLVTRADGSVKVLGVDSEIEQGDILASRTQTYATLKLTDNSLLTLGPYTDLKVERYVFYKHTPDNDGAQLALANGTVRIATGLLGTRSGDTFTLATPTATIDIRGASLIAQFVAPDGAKLAWRDTGSNPRLSNLLAVSYTPDRNPGLVRTVSQSNTVRLAQNLPPPVSSGLAPGLYVHVVDGAILLTNKGGTQNFTAGQFGFTASLTQPPVVVPQNPGLQFTPPPSFNKSVPTSQTNTGGAKANAVDCEVR